MAEKSTGRADWDTITSFYPINGTDTNTGPSSLPINVTLIAEVLPSSDSQVLPDPRFFLKDASDASLQPGNSARAFLFQTNRLVDLGSPVVDSIQARGAQAGDKVCVIEPDNLRIGCKTIDIGDNQQLTLYIRTDWQPELVVTPVTTRTVDLRVGNLPAGLTLNAQLYAGDGSTSETTLLIRSGNDYLGTFSLTDPATEGYVRVWSTSDNQLEAVTDYAMGGNPAGMRAGFAGMRSGFAGMRAGFAPGASSDGQVILYSGDLSFPEGEFYSLQEASYIPAPPNWVTPVGQGYWLMKSDNAPDLTGISLAMGYLDREVPFGEETWLRVYHWDGINWLPLVTSVDANENMAIAVVPGPGLYIIMSTIEIQLYGPGWDSFAYPIQVTRPVPEALQSISGAYTTVYWYDGSDTTDHWKVFDVSVPDWVNDLVNLQFGESYWIKLTQSITLSLDSSTAALRSREQEVQADGFPNPPATYYGAVQSGKGFIPTPGMLVKARIGNDLCGQGITLDIDGQIVYTLNVSADAMDTPGCGSENRWVQFEVGSTTMLPSIIWSNEQVWEVTLHPISDFIYLPMIIK